ncbi:FAD-dependent oxidoreductase [Liquorilactobacillus satsumensis]|uniref:glycerol-3-phosphate dehydrogenase/oxidase n=1 Tax=Liquorilactobacillus satsumensis TaxID=259059 RepID=UPI0021C35365|nr:glycerol-3-phosphate dehydrogenase/oxidase [Liquorilactobacillus satsumensis]MCP9313788.1 FAD-dependent oxidoreductase [Liquorilactobacillus satsumensis]MCP9329320.1 FAD-dependent oxidoreductase [Liquorilactobacillus satsumensis]MCP9360925.1 FAD-dependent oxidoreductase [Liquorilactobacillus satsumensis]
MTEFNSKTRFAELQTMEAKELDVLVIGGGITGAGIALDAQTRGLQTGLLEMRDFASGTSSRSTKLVHGGLRYLKQLAFHEVAEVGSERAIVYENAPHVTTPVKMMLPFYNGGTLGKFTTAIALDIYDRLAKVKKSERKFMLDRAESLAREPYLKAEGLKGTGVYVEYRTDDARLVMEVVKEAHAQGALLANYAKVMDLIYNEHGKVSGVKYQDQITGTNGTIYAKRIINAAGPWVDDIRQMDGSNKGKHLHLTKGVHLVVDNAKFPVKNAIFFDTPFNDKRMMFVIPREGKTYFGTTDTSWNEDPREPSITSKDVHYILSAVNQMFAIKPLHFDDVESAWSGVRPLIQEEGKSPSEISRKDEIFHSDSGLYSIAGGKLTGYRKMAEKIVNEVAKDFAAEYGDYHYVETQTVHLPLSGADASGSAGFKEFFDAAVTRGTEHGLSKMAAESLVHRYGRNVDAVYSYLEQAQTSETHLSALDYAQLHYGLEEEMVLHPIDYLLRRSSQMLFNFKHLEKVYEPIITEMAQYFDWSDETTARLRDEVQTQIAIRQAFKQETVHA